MNRRLLAIIGVVLVVAGILAFYLIHWREIASPT